MIDPTSTGTFQISFPQDLLRESKRVPQPTHDALRVEGWRNSWLSRLAERLIGKE